MFERKLLRHVDWQLLVYTLIIIGMGLVALYSTSRAVGISHLQRQGLFLMVGLIGLVSMMWFDFQHLPRFSSWIYWSNVFFLLLVILIGKEVKGAQRWFHIGSITIQPSEFAKLACIVTLAIHLSHHMEEVCDLRLILKTILHIGVPAGLVFLQPDLGTSLVLIAVWFGMLYFAGAKMRHLLSLALAGILLFAAAWHTGVIKDYQKQRLYAFIDPYADPQGSGYHIIQSQIAVGSGGIQGKGFLQGRMSKLRFVPAQHTDFIFTVAGEEHGFVGTAAVAMMFLLFFGRMLHVMSVTENPLGALLTGGILVMFAVHVIINIGMTIRLMPVTGLPLPFFSYGGSNLVTCCLAVGLVESVAMRRQKLMF